jgi:hypothetical protein
MTYNLGKRFPWKTFSRTLVIVCEAFALSGDASLIVHSDDQANDFTDVLLKASYEDTVVFLYSHSLLLMSNV